MQMAKLLLALGCLSRGLALLEEGVTLADPLVHPKASKEPTTWELTNLGLRNT